ncbi:hypothetical protein WG904_12735 [Pedobacter sp. Du54]|uniref:hypothetical protein n=1 Tax=Pedobacter anseongensis TaxID=3133439 RepID=UPI0030A12E11
MKAIIISVAFLLLVAMGCTTSRITYSWKSENRAEKHYDKILVLGLTHNADHSLQQQMENHMVADLTDAGYHAVSSLSEFGPKVFDGMDEQAAIRKLKNKGIDAILTITLLNKHKEKNYVPGRVYYPTSIGTSRFWDYRRGLTRIYEPGYFVVSTRYFWESNLYEMENQDLICSVQTESFNPNSSQSLAHEYGEIIIQYLLNNKILQQVH